VVLRHSFFSEVTGPTAYVVKGGWQGEPGSLRGVDLEPSVAFPPISYSREGLSLSLEAGHLNADYTTKLDDDTTLNVRVNDEKAWKASLLGQDASLKIRGEAGDLDTIFWEASQDSSVEDVGNVRVEFNSDRNYNLTVTRPLLATIAGAAVDAKVRATNDGVAGHLGVRRSLPKGAELSYSVENPVGVYELGSSKHAGRLSVPVAGGMATLNMEGNAAEQEYRGSYARNVVGGLASFEVTRNDGALGYNVSYARGLEDIAPVDASVHVGADHGGVYGKVAASRTLKNGVDAQYEALARLNLGKEEREAKFMHALKVSNSLGSAQILHGSGEAPRLRLGYEFEA